MEDGRCGLDVGWLECEACLLALGCYGSVCFDLICFGIVEIGAGTFGVLEFWSFGVLNFWGFWSLERSKQRGCLSLLSLFAIFALKVVDSNLEHFFKSMACRSI